jgi:hypothetical protein
MEDAIRRLAESIDGFRKDCRAWSNEQARLTRLLSDVLVDFKDELREQRYTRDRLERLESKVALFENVVSSHTGT